MKEVLISDLAKKENQQNIDYVEREFGIRSVFEYLDKFEEVVSLLESGMYASVYDEKLKLHKFLVVKQIYLLYEIMDEKTILIVSVWNNKRFPYWF